MPEKRKHRRIRARESAVVVELKYVPPESPEETTTIFCSTEDISTHGLRLDLDRAIAVDTPVKVTIIFKDPVRHFRHLGIVHWILPQPTPDRYYLGIEFLNRSSTDSLAWKEFLGRYFPKPRMGFLVSSDSPISEPGPKIGRSLSRKRNGRH